MSDINKRGLSIIEAGGRIGCGRSLVYDLIREGKLPARKVGNRTIILADDVDRYLSALPAIAPKRVAA